MRQEIMTVIRMLAASDPTVTSAELSALENACNGQHREKEADDFVSADVACEILGVSRTTLMRMEREGKIKATKISPRLNRYSREELRAVLGGGK